MLRVNPTWLARLDELETDLLDRRTRPEAEGWAGEIEGIDMLAVIGLLAGAAILALAGGVLMWLSGTRTDA